MAFLAGRKGATLEDLIQSKSGIYLDADPWAKRGANLPGTVMHYNNWDFNAAGTAFEKLTGHDTFDALESDLACPLGMQDFDRTKQKKPQTVTEEKISVYPEYAMYLSTRDMARLGLLMLRDGKWKDKQLMPRNWAAYLTTLFTPAAQVGPAWIRQDRNEGPMRWGYGALWWVWDGPRGANPASWTQFTVFRDGNRWPVHHGDSDERHGGGAHELRDRRAAGTGREPLRIPDYSADAARCAFRRGLSAMWAG